MPVSSSNRKVCSACGADVTFAKRVRNPDGGYFCEPCAPAPAAPPPPVEDPSPAAEPVAEEDDGGYALKEEAPPPRRRTGPVGLPSTFPPTVPARAAAGVAAPARAQPAEPAARRWWWVAVPVAVVVVIGIVAAVLMSGGHPKAARQTTPPPAIDESAPPVARAAPVPMVRSRHPAVVAAVGTGSPDPTGLLGDWHVDADWDISVSKQGDGFVLKEAWQGHASESSQWKRVGDGVAFLWGNRKDVFVVRPGPGANLTVEQYQNVGRAFFSRNQPLPATPGNAKVATRTTPDKAAAAPPAVADTGAPADDRQRSVNDVGLKFARSRYEAAQHSASADALQGRARSQPARDALATLTQANRERSACTDALKEARGCLQQLKAAQVSDAEWAEAGRQLQADPATPAELYPYLPGK